MAMSRTLWFDDTFNQYRQAVVSVNDVAGIVSDAENRHGGEITGDPSNAGVTGGVTGAET
jgi:hypothetical protein